MARESGFPGFPKKTFEFLSALERHNTKAWFDAHRADYEAFYLTPAKALVSVLGLKLRKISPHVQFDPRINGSLFRINRDIRFSKDKSPYKTHLDLLFWEGEEKDWSVPGFFFRMHSDRLMLGCGIYMLGKPQLDAYRAAVVDAKSGRALETMMAKICKTGPEIGGATRKQVPRGFDAAHPRAPLLLHEGLYAMMEGPIPKEARSSAFVDDCLKRFAKMAPVNRWLLQYVVRK
jgi:uncharacterized protein (TIGR02453 family)